MCNVCRQNGAIDSRDSQPIRGPSRRTRSRPMRAPKWRRNTRSVCRRTGGAVSDNDSPLRGVLAGALVATPAVCAIAYCVAGALGLAGAGARGLSMAYVQAVLRDPAIWRGLVWTVTRSAAATLFAVGGAITMAIVWRGNRRVDRLGRLLATLPLPIPHIVAAAGAILILGQSGLAARLAFAAGLVRVPQDLPPILYDRFGVGFICTLASKEIPFLTLVAISVLTTRGAALDEVARTLGAGRWDRLTRVTLPLLWRGLFPAAAAVFAFIAGSFEGAALLGPSDPLPLPVAMLERFNAIDLGARPQAYVIALLALGLALIATVAAALGQRHADVESAA
jgi:putative spermidine/putrescine transport system permease protein